MDYPALFVAALVCVSLICRADGLNVRDHRPEYILLHIGLFMSSFLAGMNAWDGQTGLRDWCSLLGSGAWLVVSWHSWRTGVPDHVRRHPIHAMQELRHESRCGTGDR